MSETEKLILEQLQALNQNITELNQKVDTLGQDSTVTRLLIENDISKKIDIIGEGHDFLKLKLDDALKMEKSRESMQLQILNQKMDIDKIKRHLGIA